MRRNSMITIVAMCVLAVPAVAAQGRGSGNQGRRGQGQGQQAPQAGQAQGTTTKARDMLRDRLRTQATTQQRDQYRTCDQSMDRVRTQARDMARSSAGKTFNADQARHQRDQLRDQIRNMQQEQERLMRGLTNEQRGAAQAWVRTMQRIQVAMNARLQQMNREMEKLAPDRKRISEQARMIEREMKNWQNEYHRMGDELSLKK